MADQLTQLPEALLLQIISRLPLSEAVRTGVLSSNWKNLWTHVDEITVHHVFEHRNRDGMVLATYDNRLRRTQNFVDAVLRTLTQSTCLSIKKFSLIIEGKFYDRRVLHKLIQWAFSRNVKDFTWACRVAYDYHLSKWFCHNSTLENLLIRGYAAIQLSDPVVCWPSLKNLHLSGVSISDEDMASVLSGCPVLETLFLQNTMITGELDTVKLNIVSPRVKTFRMLSTRSSPYYYYMKSYVTAPWLDYLYYDGDLSGNFFILNNVSSSLKANLKLTFDSDESMYDDDDGPFLKHGLPLLESSCDIEDLVLGSYFVHVWSFVTRSCPLLRCKRLTIYLYAKKDEFPATAHLFRSTPRVETLLINVEHIWKEFEIRYDTPDIRDVDEAYGFNTPLVDFQCLKYLKISHTFPRQNTHQCAAWPIMRRYFRFAACIMRNAPFLKELVIALAGKEEYCCSARSRNSASRYFLQFSEKIFHFMGEWFDEDDNWDIIVKKSSFEIICKRD